MQPLSVPGLRQTVAAGLLLRGRTVLRVLWTFSLPARTRHLTRQAMPKHGTILLVEHDANDVFLIRKAFEDTGVRNPLLVVSSGREAFAYLNGEGKYADRAANPFPFLILTDFKMPDGDAFDILRWLAERPQLRKKVIVIVLSSMCSDEEVGRLYEMGAKSFLLKPTIYRDLVATIRKVKDFWIDSAITPGNSTGPAS